jgi:hypothetical protein
VPRALRRKSVIDPLALDAKSRPRFGRSLAPRNVLVFDVAVCDIKGYRAK